MFFSPGEYIKRHRKKIKLTQKELGEKISVTQELISLWENNKKRPSYEKIKLLGSLLKVDLSEIAEIMGYSRYYDYPSGQEIETGYSNQVPENVTLTAITNTSEKMDKIIEKIGELERKIEFIDKVTVKVENEKDTENTEPLLPESLKIDVTDNVNLIPILEGQAACGTPSVLTQDMIDDYLTFPSDYSIPADFIITAKGDSMIEEGITDGMLCFIKKQDACNSGELILLNVYECDESNLIIKKSRTVQNIMVFQDGKGNIMEIPEEGRMDIIGKVIYKSDDPRQFL